MSLGYSPDPIASQYPLRRAAALSTTFLIACSFSSPPYFSIAGAILCPSSYLLCQNKVCKSHENESVHE
jgi:hypothetical protein